MTRQQELRELLCRLSDEAFCLFKERNACAMSGDWMGYCVTAQKFNVTCARHDKTKRLLDKEGMQR